MRAEGCVYCTLVIATLTRPHGDDPLTRGPDDQVTFLVVALDCGEPLRRPLRIHLDPLTEVRIGRGTRRVVTPTATPGTVELKLPDAWMSSSHLRVRRVGSAWLYEDVGAKNATLLNGVACQNALLVDGDVLTAGGTLLMLSVRPAPADGARDLDTELERRPAGFATLIPMLDETFRTAERVARSRVPLFLHGETGSGKEVVARALHEASGLAGAFVPVNCGGLPATLVESELFGVRKGAYTGVAEDRPGLIRESDGGTLFLDEIGELPAAAQAALLRVLQDGEVRPLGGSRAVKVNLRLASATHRDLESMIEGSQFRRDLYARLSGHHVSLPPLRERREDLGLLVADLLERLAPARAARLRLAPAAALALFLHDWPMNVRELEQCLASALAVTSADEIGLPHLPEAVREAPRVAPPPATVPASGSASAAVAPPSPPSPPPVHPARRVAQLLREHRGNVSAVARALATSRSQVRRLALRAGIDMSKLRDDGDGEGS